MKKQSILDSIMHMFCLFTHVKIRRNAKRYANSAMFIRQIKMDEEEIIVFFVYKIQMQFKE